MLYLYAITDTETADLPDMTGVEGARLQAVDYQRITAMVSVVDTARPEPTPEHLWQHETAIEALMTDRAVLPARFGTVLADQEAVRSALAAHYERLVENLRFVAGRVEVGVRVLWAEDERPTTVVATDAICPVAKTDNGQQVNSGRAYIMARLAEERAVQARRALAEQQAAALHGPLAQLAVASAQRTLATPRLLLAAAYLIERDQIDAFKREVERLSAHHPDLRLLGTGPWPPYHFVTVTGENG
ncbi:MAG: GvpL/GvpF family gas vesicle protein [Blastochloris sp.]|nr:GvpL/GvpF family gas vesicle protein [Blastochloris sp.]